MQVVKPNKHLRRDARREKEVILKPARHPERDTCQEKEVIDCEYNHPEIPQIFTIE